MLQDLLLGHLLGNRDPRTLVELAHLQLKSGRLALANSPELMATAAKLCKERAKLYEASSTLEDLKAQYDFNSHIGRLAFAAACLPEHLRSTVLHDVFKTLCVWIGKSGEWAETTPGSMLRASKERLRCMDTSAAVLQQVKDVLCPAVDSNATLDEFADALHDYLAEMFDKADVELAKMEKCTEDLNDDGLLDRLAAAMPDDEEEDSETDVVDNWASAHPLAGKRCYLRDDVRHPHRQISSIPVDVIDWDVRANPQPEELYEFNMRQDIYNLPQDGKYVMVKAVAHEYGEDRLIVHETEIEADTH